MGGEEAKEEAEEEDEEEDEEKRAMMERSQPVLTDQLLCLMATGLDIIIIILITTNCRSSRSTPPCEDGSGKPMTCADGSTPGRGGGGGRGGCRRTSKICCDGSTPVFDGDRSSPPCSDGNRPVCSLAQCSAEGTNPEIDVEVVVGEQF